MNIANTLAVLMGSALVIVRIFSTDRTSVQ
jgi:hypothetical protein